MIAPTLACVEANQSQLAKNAAVRYNLGAAVHPPASCNQNLSEDQWSASTMTEQTHHLFSPASFGSLVLRNRLVRSATAEQLATEPVGRATPALASLYGDLSRGGVGLVITGHAFVSPAGKAHPEMLGIHCDEMIPGLKTLADAVHAGGGAIAVQIQHGGRQSTTDAVPRSRGAGSTSRSCSARASSRLRE